MGRRATILVIGLAVVAACSPADGRTLTADPDVRTIHIRMVDIAFEPAVVRISPGERVLFVFTNVGELPHEAVIGDVREQAEHRDQMDADDAGHRHDDASDHTDHTSEDVLGLQLEPGERGELRYDVDSEPGDLTIACHLPGHLEAGMQVRFEHG